MKKNNLERKVRRKSIIQPIVLATSILSTLITKEVLANSIQKFTYHTVKKGENIASIVLDYQKDGYNTNYNFVIKTNRDKIKYPDIIFPNQELLIAEPIKKIPLDYLINIIKYELERKEVSKLLSPKDILALMYAETQFNPYLIDIAKKKSNKRIEVEISKGILQVSKQGLEDVRKNYDKDTEFFYDLYNIEDNIAIAIKILELIYIREKSKGNKNITVEEEFSRYNAGSENVDYWKKTKQWDGKANTIRKIKIPATRKLLIRYQYYRKLLEENKVSY